MAADSKPTSNAVAARDSSIEPTPALTQKNGLAKSTPGGLCSSSKQGLERSLDLDINDKNIDESAIDESDSSGWEDLQDSGKSSVDAKLFQRTESNLVSRCSLITLMLAQTQRQESHSTSAITSSHTRPSAPTTFSASSHDSHECMRPLGLEPIIDIPRPSAQPTIAPTNYVHAQTALSPRTTRRNMIATELPEFLRLQLLWERKSEKPYQKKSEDANARSRNLDIYLNAFNSYHSKGW